MYYPISEHLDDIYKVHKVIPSDRAITRTDIVGLTQNQIESLQMYAFYTIDYSISENEHFCLKAILTLCDRVFYAIEDGSVVLAPGDSPSKIIQLINLMYHQGGDVYLKDSVEKSITFVNFPISRLTRPSFDLGLLDKYLSKVLQNVTIDDKLVYLDYFSTGGTYNTLLNSLRTIMGDINLEVPSININELWKQVGNKECYDTFMRLIAETERVEDRCIPKYTLGTTMRNINMMRCNIIIAMLYLLYLGRLSHDVFLQNVTNDNLYPKGDLVKMTYYDISLLGLNTVICLLHYYYYPFIDIEVIVDGSYKLKEEAIFLGSIVYMEKLPIEISQSELGAHKDKYLRVTLINKEIFEGWYYGGRAFSIGLDYIHISNVFISKIEPKPINNPNIDIKFFLGSISEITYLGNGKLTTEIFYIDSLIGGCTCVTPDHFIVHNIEEKVGNFTIVSLPLIQNITLINRSSVDLINCYCTVGYQNGNVIDELTDNWKLVDVDIKYYQAEKSKISVIPRLIKYITPPYSRAQTVPIFKASTIAVKPQNPISKPPTVPIFKASTIAVKPENPTSKAPTVTIKTQKSRIPVFKASTIAMKPQNRTVPVFKVPSFQ